MKGRFKGLWYALLAALLAGGGLLVAYILFGVAPFGELTLLHGDMNTQYARFYSYLMRTLHGQESLLYSFHAGLGSSMLPTFTYYLASPFSLLAYFFDAKHIPELLMLMTILKVACMAAAYVCFARRALRDDSPRAIVFALCYALCSYVVGYASNIMWLDALILLPLILTCATKLARGEGSRGLTLLLALLFFTQFYIAYMVGIFTFLWLLAALFIYRSPKKMRKLLTLVGKAVLAAGCCAVTLLPTGLRLLENAGFPDATPLPVWAFSHDLRQLFSRSLFGIYDTLMGKRGSMPPLYCGTITLLLLPAYLTNKGIALRERLIVLAGNVFLLLCMALPPLTFAWHAFDEAAWFQYRYAFLLVFVWVFAANRCMQHLSTTRWWVFGLCGAGVALYYGLRPIELTSTYYVAIQATVWLLAGWTAAGLLVYFLKGRWRTALLAVLSVALLSELVLNANLLLNSIDQEVPFVASEDYRDNYDTHQTVLAELPEEDAPYRLEYLDTNAPNRNLDFGTMGQQFYSTAAQRALTLGLNNLGFYSSGIYQSRSGATMATDSLFGIRYVVGEESPNEYYHPEAEAGDIAAFENDYVFPLAFTASDQALAYTLPERVLRYDYYVYFFNATNPFERLNGMFQALAGDDSLEVFVEIPLEDTRAVGLTVEPEPNGGVILRAIPDSGELPMLYYDNLTAELDAPVYGMFHAISEVDGIVVELDGYALHEQLSSAGAEILYIGQYLPGDEIPLAVYLSGEQVYLDSEHLYALDTDLLWDLGGEFYGATMENVSWGNTRISGTVNAGEDQILFLSIPYDGGWSATVDGRKVQVEPALSIFSGVPLEAGEHEVVLTYRPVGFLPGALISGVSLLICLGLWLWGKRKKDVTPTQA